MTAIGYFLSCEEHGPTEILASAQAADRAGFDRVQISDHFHPWLTEQGASPFVWSMIGAIAATTELHVTTAVTCPLVRIHPAIIAQAAATSAILLDGRFSLGVGSGEALNEHILADRWPPADVRLDMLGEAVELIRELLGGEEVTHRGPHYTVEKAKIWSAPREVPDILVSAFGPKAAQVAATVGDGLVTAAVNTDVLEAFDTHGGKGPKQGGVKFAWGADPDECVERAHRLWRTAGVPGQLSQDLPTVVHFEQAAQNVTVDMIRDAIVHGPDPEPYVKAIKEFSDAGYDEVYVNQIGDDEAGFMDFFNREVRPLL